MLLTALLTGLALLPVALQLHQPGHEIEGPMAVVILGGLVSSTLVSLLLIPPLAARWLRPDNFLTRTRAMKINTAIVVAGLRLLACGCTWAAAPPLTASKTITIDASAAKVWHMAKDFNGLNTWHPAVATDEIVEGKNNTVGAVRLLTLKGGGTIKEKLLAFDPAGRSFKYAILEGVLPVSGYTSTLAVKSAGKDKSSVTWTGHFKRKNVGDNPADKENDKTAVDTMSGVYQAGLDNLKKIWRRPNKGPTHAMNALDSFHPAVAAWFSRTFDAPTPAQEQAWPALQAGQHVLVAAPTGSGKTFAAFLAAIDQLVKEGLAGTAAGRDPHRLRVAAEGSVERHSAQSRGAARGNSRRARGVEPARCRRFARWCAPATPRRRSARGMRRKAPHIVVTTPESLYILLGSQSGRGHARDLPHGDRR